MSRISFPNRQQWDDELKNLLRGLSGGFLFGIPLLFTMEIWWIGSYTQPFLLLIVLAITFVIVFLLNHTDGFRQARPKQPLQTAMDSVEALAIGILCVTLVLVLLREITPETALSETLGKIVLEGVPFSIGVALARSIMVGNRESDQSPSPDSQSTSKNSYHHALADIGATLVGTIFIAFNIAPTDEVSMLAAATSPVWLLAMISASLAISYCIVFAAGFTTQEQRLQQQGVFQHPMVETVMAYLLSLLAAALMLWFFHRLSFADPWTSWLEQVLILGLPATIGGSAGRITV